MARELVVVDGIDGSGKSSFARLVEQACARRSIDAAVLSIDDFRCDVDWSEGGEGEAYYDRYFDLDGVDTCAQAFLQGREELTIPVFDPDAGAVVGARTQAVAADAIAVLEGVFPLRVPSARAGLLIYLQTSFATARGRILERDQKRGRSLDEVERRVDRRYFPGQRRYLAEHDPVARAAVVIDNEDYANPIVRRADLDGSSVALRAILDDVLGP